MISLNSFEKQHIYMPFRKQEGHKGDFGHVYTIGGSIGLSGAISLSSEAALKTGCGLVTAIIPQSINEIFEIKNTECMSVPINDFTESYYDTIINHIKNADSVAFGMGIGRNKNIISILDNLLTDYCGKLLIDADGLFAISKINTLLKCSNADIILTPHSMEFSRISGYSLENIKNNRKKLSEKYAEENKVTLVLKGKNTVVTNGKETYINMTGNSGLATAGAGDVLSGIIASLSAQGMCSFDAACTGVFLHGLAGDFAASENNEYCITATDIIKYLGKAISSLLEGSK